MLVYGLVIMYQKLVSGNVWENQISSIQVCHLAQYDQGQNLGSQSTLQDYTKFFGEFEITPSIVLFWLKVHPIQVEMKKNRISMHNVCFYSKNYTSRLFSTLGTQCPPTGDRKGSRRSRRSLGLPDPNCHYSIFEDIFSKSNFQNFCKTESYFEKTFHDTFFGGAWRRAEVFRES